MGRQVNSLEQDKSRVKTWKRKLKFQLLDPNPSDLAMIRLIDRTCECCNILGWIVASGEMLIELGDSWFIAKTMVVVRLLKFYLV